MKLLHWLLMGGPLGCHIWYSEEGSGRGRSSPRHLLAVPSTASVPITVLLYNGSFLYGFNVPTES